MRVSWRVLWLLTRWNRVGDSLGLAQPHHMNVAFKLTDRNWGAGGLARRCDLTFTHFSGLTPLSVMVVSGLSSRTLSLVHLGSSLVQMLMGTIQLGQSSPARHTRRGANQKPARAASRLRDSNNVQRHSPSCGPLAQNFFCDILRMRSSPCYKKTKASLKQEGAHPPPAGGFGHPKQLMQVWSADFLFL